MQELNASQLVNVARSFLRLDIPVMIWGEPGIGKSQVVKQLAREDNALELEIRLSQYDSVDLRGIPHIAKTEHGGSMTAWAPASTLPFVGNPNFPSDRPIYLFLDELPQAMTAVQAPAFQLVLDRCIGEHALMPNVRVLAAGNLEDHKAGANRDSDGMSHTTVWLLPDQYLRPTVSTPFSSLCR